MRLDDLIGSIEFDRLTRGHGLCAGNARNKNGCWLRDSVDNSNHRHSDCDSVRWIDHTGLAMA